MQIKVNFLCRDSILAAPIVLDVALFMDLAQRAGFSGVQEWLSFYFKSPMTAPKAGRGGAAKRQHGLLVG
jgi:myo-inositol-1-phosphate synthase